jgi:membrane-associated phospholipid phosphatase
MLEQSGLRKPEVIKPSNYFTTKLAKFITNITAPPLIAIPCLIILGLQDEHNRGIHNNLIISLAIAIIFGATLPIILVVTMYLLKKINDIHIATREQRNLPFLLTIISFIIGTCLLWFITGFSWLTVVMASYSINTLVVMLINFKWKISIHATSIGGIVAAFTMLGGWMATPLISVIWLVTWARVYLKAHTTGQVLVGSLLGFFFTLIQLIILLES